MEQSRSIDELPNEVLLEIFQLLPLDSLAVCSNVCRRWRQLVRYQCLWLKDVWQTEESPFAEYAVRQLLMLANRHILGVEFLTSDKFTVKLRKKTIHLELPLDAWARCRRSIVYGIRRRKHTLTQLILGGKARDKYSAEELQPLRELLLDVLPLPRLTLLRSSGPGTIAVQEALPEILRTSPALGVLNMKGCRADYPTTDGEYNGLQPLPHLWCLVVDCRPVDDAPEPTTEAEFEQLRMPAAVKAMEFALQSPQLTMAAISAECIEVPMPNLERLFLEVSHVPQTFEFHKILQLAPKLENLHLTGPWPLDEYIIPLIIDELPYVACHRGPVTASFSIGYESRQKVKRVQDTMRKNTERMQRQERLLQEQLQRQQLREEQRRFLQQQRQLARLPSHRRHLVDDDDSSDEN